MTLTLHGGRLLLPVRPVRDGEPAPPAFGPAEQADPLAVETLEPGRTNRTQSFDLATGTHEIRFEWDVGGHRRLVKAGTEMEDTNVGPTASPRATPCPPRSTSPARARSAAATGAPGSRPRAA